LYTTSIYYCCVVGRISLVKAEKARAVEDIILRAAQSGQLAEKVDEKKLIQLLEQIAEKQTKTKIIVILYYPNLFIL
jgi:programmed cell death protein 5